MSQYKVGGEVDAICTRCKLVRADGRPQLLAHTILAMVGTKIARVRCNTCDSDHAYRADAPASSSSGAPRAPRAAAASSAEPSRAAVSVMDEIRRRDPATLQKYSIKVSFKVDDFIEHPTFGQGIVTSVRADKIEVSFKAEVRTLVHARAEGLSQAKPTFQRPTALAGGPADKPLPEDAGG